MSPWLNFANIWLWPIFVAISMTFWFSSRVWHLCTSFENPPQKKHFSEWVGFSSLLLVDLRFASLSNTSLSLSSSLWKAGSKLLTWGSFLFRSSFCLLYADIHDLWNTVFFSRKMVQSFSKLSYFSQCDESNVGNALTCWNAFKSLDTVW